MFARGDDVAALASSIRDALQIPLTLPRGRVLANFSLDTWLDRCDRLYARVSSRRSLSCVPAAGGGASQG